MDPASTQESVAQRSLTDVAIGVLAPDNLALDLSITP